MDDTELQAGVNEHLLSVMDDEDDKARDICMILIPQYVSDPLSNPEPYHHPITVKHLPDGAMNFSRNDNYIYLYPEQVIALRKALNFLQADNDTVHVEVVCSNRS